jgi:hypothetical protein
MPICAEINETMTRRRVKWLLAATVLLAALSPACQDEPEPGECSVLTRDVWTDELFNLYAYGHDFTPFCSAGFELAHDHAQWVADAWGESPLKFDYGLFESDQDPCWPCSPTQGNCAFQENLAATRLPHRHEIAHAVRGVPCPTFLEEGWAMLYGEHFEEAETAGTLRELADSRQLGIPVEEYYPVAARFVAFVIETRGLDGLKALCEFPIKDSESLEVALIQVFDQALDEISAEFADYPAWSLAQLRQDQACEGSEVTSVPGDWRVELACGGAGVEGREGGPLIAHHVVEVPETGNYQLQFEASVDFHVLMEIRSCTRDGMALVFYHPYEVYGQAGVPEGRILWDLAAGKYVIRLKLRDSADPLALDVNMGSWL